jgi:hypothetical protein
VKYQSASARIETCDRLMSRLLSWKTYLPQYGSAAPPRPPPAAGWPDARDALQVAVEPVDVAIAAVGIRLRGDRHVDVVADLADERGRLRREP